MSTESLQHQMSGFLPVVREWFAEAVGNPTEAQVRGWEQIARGKSVLICAPTGSGKTLAAFLQCLDFMYRTKKGGADSGIKVVYISPLKALNNDIYRNLQVPLAGIGERAAAAGLTLPAIEVAVRTGDTPQKDRRAMLKHPPDILITTPESLFRMLTSPKSARLFTPVEWIIVDEIHALCANKRGVHLSLSVERLERTAKKAPARIGLSATINPVEEVAEFLGGYAGGPDGRRTGREVAVVDCGRRRAIDLGVNIPVKDLRDLPGKTVWPSVWAQLLAFVRAHRSTLVFVNSRRTAEMVVAGVNDLAGEPLAKTHHGSVSRQVRQEIEEQFKNGEIPCLVATSSLELGIDVGRIDLVIQLGVLNSVAQAVQRIGRSGHSVHTVSRGVFIPRTRADLLSLAFLAREAAQYRIEKIHIPFNCLDVLAQHLVSMSCAGIADCAVMFGLVRGAYPYKDLTYEQFRNVLLMLAYPAGGDGAASPRILYDGATGRVAGTALGRMMCLLSGGVITDKGNYPVYLRDGKVKLGELDEEFVFESRLGDRFVLGSAVWRLEAVEHDRVVVTPSTQSGARIPFWIGDNMMRSFETGVNYGKFLALLRDRVDAADYYDWIEKECRLDRTAAENLRQYVNDQIQATGHIQNDRLIVCEYFSDEAGDKRILVHSPFGGRIHAALAIILQARLAAAAGCQVEYVYNDDGILFHLVGSAADVHNVLSLLDCTDFADEIMERLPSAPVFNMLLRYNIIRSFLLGSPGRGKRNPLWIQRLRSAEVAAQIVKTPDHPVVTETYRECINDILDIESLYNVVRGIKTGDIKVVETRKAKPSPFCAELLFNFWQVYQYVNDLPVAEKRSQLLVTDREFIRLAMGNDAAYDLLDARAIEAVEGELRRSRYAVKIQNPEELYNYLYTYGELAATPYQCADLADGGLAPLARLEAQGRAVRLPLNRTDTRYWIAAEDYPVYCRALEVDARTQILQVGLPGREYAVPAGKWLNAYIFTLAMDKASSVLRIIRRHISFCGPFTISGLLKRYNIRRKLIVQAIETLVDSGVVYRLNEDEEAIYCQAKVYDRIKRKTLLLARKDIKPREKDDYCRFVFRCQGIAEDRVCGDDRLQDAISKLEGLYLPAAWWEDFVFPARVKKYEGRMLDNLCAAGLVRWRGRQKGSRPEVAFFTRPLADCANAVGSPADGLAARVSALLREKGALFISDICEDLNVSVSDVLQALEELVWRGAVANDSFSVIRYYVDNRKANSPWIRYQKYPQMGRWFLVPSGENLTREQLLDTCVQRLLNRYGLINKDILAMEKGLFNWAEVYRYLKEREFGSDVKRGFYVAGVSGIQFARRADVEALRDDRRNANNTYVTICACDPSNVYNSLFKEESAGSMPRTPGTAVVFREGVPALFVRGYGSHMLPQSPDADVVNEAVANLVQTYGGGLLWLQRKRIFVQYWGEGRQGIEKSPVYDLLLELGFRRSYPGVTYRR